MALGGFTPAKLAKWRLLAGLSQIELARRTTHEWHGKTVKLHESTVQMMEKREDYRVSEELLVLMAQVIQDAIHDAYPALAHLIVTSTDLCETDPATVLAQMRLPPQRGGIRRENLGAL